MAQVIQIVKKRVGGKNVVEPQDGKRTRVKQNGMVKFTFPADEVDPGTRPTIEFTGDNPLDGPVVYGRELKVTGAVGKVFPYTCTMTIGGETFSTNNGGEMEVIQG
jgi:hypothetical protein